MSCKILIMVLSFMDEPYKSLYESQAATWDSIPEEDVHTLFYHGGAEEVKADLVRQHHKSTSTIIQTEDTDEYYRMSAKFRTALKYALLSRPTLIFRTNSSSAICKKRLKEFANALPKEKLYAGWTMVDSNDDHGLSVSGAGIWISPDVAEILVEQIDPGFQMEEDIYFSRILRKNGIQAIDDKSRFDVPEVFDDVPRDRYHYRLKCGASREVDIANMKKLHQILNS